MPSRLFYTLVKIIILIILKPFINIKVNHHCPSHCGPKIYTANHPSTLDPLFVITRLKDRVSILLTYSVFNIPLVGYILKKSGHIPVVDNNGRLAYNQALAKLRSGQSILIFPEGRLSGPSIQPIFSGAIRLAIETGAPIVPIGISLRGKTIDKQIKIKSKVDLAKFFILGKYRLTFGKIIYPKGNLQNKSQLDQLKNNLTEAIRQLALISHLGLYSPSYNFTKSNK